MANSYIGEIRMFAGNFAPSGWAFCSGQAIAIDQNTALFTLLGTTYGGDGVTYFRLPDLRSRVPIHQGQGPGPSSYVLGESVGQEQVALTPGQLPAHFHEFVSTAAPTGDTPAGNVLGGSASGPSMYASGTINNVTLNSSASLPAGGNQPHANLMSYLCTSFIISLYGIFPSQN
jgi:microcystin-dependent protein